MGQKFHLTERKGFFRSSPTNDVVGLMAFWRSVFGLPSMGF